MKPEKMVSMELRNLSIMIKRYVGKDRTENICKPDEDHPHHQGKATHMHMLVMNYLVANKNKDIFQRDFEKEFSIRRSTATTMLQRMEKQGLIKRVPVPEDARLKKIVLTEKAEKFTRSMEEKTLKLEKKLTAGFTEEEIKTMTNLIKKMINNMEEEN